MPSLVEVHLGLGVAESHKKFKEANNSINELKEVVSNGKSLE